MKKKQAAQRQQLELRVFADIKRVDDKTTPQRLKTERLSDEVPHGGEASEDDRAIYAAIAARYFES